MRVTVLGATGGIGGEVVCQTLDRGREVTAVVRDARRVQVKDVRLRVVTVPDLQQPDLLVPPVEGRDAVLSAVGPRGSKAGPAAAIVGWSPSARFRRARSRRGRACSTGAS